MALVGTCAGYRMVKAGAERDRGANEGVVVCRHCWRSVSGVAKNAGVAKVSKSWNEVL